MRAIGLVVLFFITPTAGAARDVPFYFSKADSDVRGIVKIEITGSMNRAKISWSGVGNNLGTGGIERITFCVKAFRGDGTELRTIASPDEPCLLKLSADKWAPGSSVAWKPQTKILALGVDTNPLVAIQYSISLGMFYPYSSLSRPQPKYEIEDTPTVSFNATSSFAFSSIPSGAEIYVVGSFVGSTPSSASLKAGEHRISIRKKGFEEWQRTIATAQGDFKSISADLEPE